MEIQDSIETVDNNTKTNSHKRKLDVIVRSDSHSYAVIASNSCKWSIL